MQAGQSEVLVQLGPRSYCVRITTDALGEVGAFARERIPLHRAVLVTDSGAQPHARIVAEALQVAGAQVHEALVPPGEKSKSLAQASALYDQLVAWRADRQTLLVAVGGGVVGDLAGFVAATYTRGIPYLQVPTTLLAQVDSSVGGKVAVNHPKAKNQIGAFYQPVGVFIDTRVLDTLPQREYACGLAEVVKYGVILDADFFEYLETNIEPIRRRDHAVLRRIVTRSCQLKAQVVEQDEREQTGQRAVLNLGHTFAHAFETLSGYEDLRHSEAVAVGMVCAARLAERMGRVDASLASRLVALLKALGLPATLKEVDADRVLEVMQHDKKAAAGKLRFVLPDRLGHVELVEDVNPADVRAVL